MRKTSDVLLGLLLVAFLPARPALAVDGVSVTTHWEGTNNNLYGGYGQIWRHDILESTVTGHTLLYDYPQLPARNPVISPDGTRVAFLRIDGRIGVVGIEGGAVTVLPEAFAHGEACLDWPQGEWIYYTRGGFSQPSGSKWLHRVHAQTGQDEVVLTFRKDDGLSPCGTWRFGLASDLRRLVVRSDDSPPEPYGRITAVDMVAEQGRLPLNRSTNRWSCSSGVDPYGEFFMDGHQDHEGVDILDFEGMGMQKSIRWIDALGWGPDQTDTGVSHDRNSWSANSADWICIHVGWGLRGATGANQMLINWADEERIVVTGNTADSYRFDCAGDFFVTSLDPEAPRILEQPADVTLTEGETAAFFVRALGVPQVQYQWRRDGAVIEGAREPGLSFTARLEDDGAWLNCRISNSEGTLTSESALLSVLVDEIPPAVERVESVGDPRSVDIVFSEPVSDSSATDPAHYAIDQGVGVLSASPDPAGNQVTLTTTDLEVGTPYRLSIEGVADRAAVPNVMAPGTSVEFTHIDVGDGLRAEYFDDPDLAGDAIVWYEPRLDFDWGTGSPDPLIDPDTFSARWTGRIRSLQDGPHTFYALTDDGVRLWIGGQLLIDQWSIQPPTEYRATVDLTAGVQTDLVMEYFEGTGHAMAFLRWSGPSIPYQVIPRDALFSPNVGSANRAPQVDAGADQWTRAGADLLLAGQVTDDGVPGDLVVAWSVVSGPGEADFLTPDLETSYVRLDTVGEYVLRLIGSDGEKGAYDQVVVHVQPPPSLTIAWPAGGETLQAGSPVRIQWSASDVDDVRIDFSADGGETWQTVAFSVDTSSPYWGDYPWLVPFQPTGQGLIELSEYSLVTSARSGSFTIEETSPSIALLAPQAHDTLTGGETAAIQWTVSGLDRVVLEYTLDDGASWLSIRSVGARDPEWEDFSWTVPDVSSSFGGVRVRAGSGSPEAQAKPLDFRPAGLGPGEVELTRFGFQGHIPPEAGTFREVQVDGSWFPVSEDRTFQAEIEVPPGIGQKVFEISCSQGERTYRRLVTLNLEDIDVPIEGLDVSARALREFLGGRSGVLVWVDAGGQVNVLDFRETDPEVRLLSEDLDCVNPLISPDGTRVVYSRGRPNGPKLIVLRRLSGGDARLLAQGDVGYWFRKSAMAPESIVYCDWSEKAQNGADGATRRQRLFAGDILPDGDPVELHHRAMDAGPNGDLAWLGQVYENLWACHLDSDTEYPTGRFFQFDGSPADHQTCNGSMAPDASARLMTLVIPHETVRIYSWEPQSDTFRESSRFELPDGMVEWEFPEWSTDPEYFSAVLRTADLRNHLYLGRVEDGQGVPRLLPISLDGANVTYSHLYLESE